MDLVVSLAFNRTGSRGADLVGADMVEFLAGSASAGLPGNHALGIGQAAPSAG